MSSSQAAAPAPAGFRRRLGHVLALGVDNPKAGRIAYLDLAKVLAIYAVVFNHTGQFGFQHYLAWSPSGLAYWAGLSLSISCKVAVPLYFMASGAVLLGRDEPLRVVWGKRVKRMAIVILVMGLLQYALRKQGFFGAEADYAASPAGVGDFCRAMLSGGILNWFLYSYLGFLMLLPLLRAMAQNLKPQHFTYLICLGVGYQLLVASLKAWLGWGITNYFSLPLATANFVFYPLLGYWLGEQVKVKRIQGRLVGLALAASALSIAYTAVMTWHDGVTGGDPSTQFYFNSLVAVTTLTCMLTLAWALQRWPLPRRAAQAVMWLAGGVFGVYLTEGILRNQFLWDLIEAWAPGITTLPATLVGVALIVTGGLIAVNLVRLIPPVRRYI
ncbi:MAG: acyltransferase family protein [Bifidobacteriaceae bacterium]|nr:acyltransferase family protein [Bifidobacteriaceae bacterium]